jgi:hypothetical protein
LQIQSAVSVAQNLAPCIHRGRAQLAQRSYL